MKFLCLCHYDRQKFERLLKDDFTTIEQECRPRDEALRRSGHLVLVGSLSLPPASKTIRPGQDSPAVTDGPYAETSEPIGAFFIVEAADIDEAVRIASLHPGAHLGRLLGGGIEVRACESYETA